MSGLMGASMKSLEVIESLKSDCKLAEDFLGKLQVVQPESYDVMLSLVWIVMDRIQARGLAIMDNTCKFQVQQMDIQEVKSMVERNKKALSL